MSQEKFNVILDGNTIHGVSVAAAVADLAKLIKRDNSFAANLLSGQPTNIKSGIDSVTGARYLAALKRIGVAAHLEPETLDIDAEVVPVPISNSGTQRTPSIDDVMPNGFSKPVSGAPKAKAQSSRLSRLVAWPNLLFVVVLTIVGIVAASNSTTVLDGIGRAIGVVAVPCIIGLAWTSLRQDWHMLKWLYVGSTILFVVISFTAPPVGRQVEAVATQSSTARDKPSAQPEAPPRSSPAPSVFVEPDDFTPHLIGTWDCNALTTGRRLQLTLSHNMTASLVALDGAPVSSPPSAWRVENSVLLVQVYPDQTYTKAHINLLTGTSLVYIAKNGAKVECSRSR